MALTYTPEVEAGLQCPDFSLPCVSGEHYSLNSFKEANALVVMFICNHCPYVKAIEDRLIQLAADLKQKNVATIGICSNDPSDYEEDSFENLKKRWMEKGFDFPYLWDESQQVAQRFGAVCTPDFFVYGKDRKLFYRGRLDDSWKNPAAVQSQELKEAVLAHLAGEKLGKEMIPSMGCSIKWKES